jgi:ectoine hydroxylase-related dioxygenase (phytanoyl-CoA dioxygenase family)
MLGRFLRPDAAKQIAALDIDPKVKAHALEVVAKGYTVVRGAIPPMQCKAVINAFRRLETLNAAIFAENRNQFGHYPRIVNLHTVMPQLLPLFTANPIWLQTQDVLFGAPTVLYTSLFYETGSQQPLHRDTPVFATRPEYLYFGTTVYLEPAGEENGCLEVMEGGHKMAELDRNAMAVRRFGASDKIPDVDGDLWNEYQNTVVADGRAKGLEVKHLHVQAGDSLIWHPQLPHGGTPIKDKQRTRFSFVMHTTPEGVPVYHFPAFFDPERKLSETASWGYREVGGRKIADFRYGISFDHARNYTLDQIKPL